MASFYEVKDTKEMAQVLKNLRNTFREQFGEELEDWLVVEILEDILNDKMRQYLRDNLGDLHPKSIMNAAALFSVDSNPQAVALEQAESVVQPEEKPKKKAKKVKKEHH